MDVSKSNVSSARTVNQPRFHQQTTRGQLHHHEQPWKFRHASIFARCRAVWVAGTYHGEHDGHSAPECAGDPDARGAGAGRRLGGALCGVGGVCSTGYCCCTTTASVGRQVVAQAAVCVA